MEGTIGEIRMFAGNFAPRNWAFCSGQLLSIAQNTALFSILGTTYGGNGTTTFALPNLSGRVPVGTGQGPGLSDIVLGEVAGEENHTLIITEMPMHNHIATAPAAGTSTTATPSASVAPGPVSLGAGLSNAFGTASTNLAPPTIGIAGGSQPHNNMQPYLGMNYIICMFGIFPSRN
jgi:microcystin-dependent protein